MLNSKEYLDFLKSKDWDNLTEEDKKEIKEKVKTPELKKLFEDYDFYFVNRYNSKRVAAPDWRDYKKKD